ncbi:hypothetical protein [Glycomyces sp. NPDC021274]|uniref:hypothetical protein n=1 Tax=Glycomyces sp. NPDC021274 TaxID=3155120 RepID=UPI0033F33A18
MNDFERTPQPSKRTLATRRAGEIRRQRIAQVRERETRIEGTVIDVLTAKLAVEEGRLAIAAGVQELQQLGETQESIGKLCDLTIGEVRAFLAAARDQESATA